MSDFRILTEYVYDRKEICIKHISGLWLMAISNYGMYRVGGLCPVNFDVEDGILKIIGVDVL